MPAIRTWRERITASVLAALLLCGTLPARAAEPLQPELFSAQDAGLASLSSSAGSWNKTFTASVTGGYVLTLSPDETSFSLCALPNETDPRYGPAITVDGEPVGYGEASPEIALQPGEKRFVELVSTPKDGAPLRYQITAYRAAAQVELTAVTDGGVFADGSRQVKLEIRLDEGAQLDSFGLELAFDPAQLRLAKPATNEASETLGAVLAFDPAFPKSLQAFDPLADNDAGCLRLGFALKSSASPAYYTATEKPMLTVCFRLEPGGALTGEALSLAVGASARYGAYYGDSKANVTAAYDGIVRWEGLTRAVRLPEVREVEGGRLQISPDKQAYGYGETVSITAAPDAGYGFAGWTGLPDGLRSAAYQSELRVTLWEDTDLSALEAAFDRLDETTAEGVKLDYTGPYLGEALLAYNPPYGAAQAVGGGFAPAEESAALDEAAPQATGFSERTAAEEDPRGLTETELFEEPLADAAAYLGAEPYALEEPEPGVTTRSFQMRDTRVSNSGAADAWAAGEFVLAAMREVNGQTLYVWLCTEEERQPVALTDAELTELADSFAESYAYLADNLRPVTDTNGNGGLDILLYDIWDPYTDGGNSYVGGFINSNEFYGLLGPDTAYGVGNSGDVLHLDTWPQMGDRETPDLSKTKSTMAHETQHLSMCSVFDSAAEWRAAKVPTWINEGLSLTVEHALFGPLETRIAKYNTSQYIKNGDPLTVWGNRTDDYAQSYLFFQYLRAQAGNDAFAEAFYTTYGTDEAGALESALQSIPAFADKSAADVMRDFYLALLLGEGAGPYGFGGEPAFQAVRPQKLSERELASLGKLPSSGAVYLASPGVFAPYAENKVQYVGVTEPAYLLTVGEAEGGSARAAGGQMRYARGETAELTAAPLPGWRFAGWAGDATGADDPLSLRMDGDKTVTPVFEPIPTYTLTLVYDSARGSVEVTDETGAAREDLGNLAEGTALTLTAKPRAGARFGGFSGAVESARTSVAVTMDGDQTVYAAFTEAPTVPAGDLLAPEPGGAAPTVDAAAGTATLTQAGGTVVLRPAADTPLRADGSLPEGAAITLRAEPAPGKVFRHWQTFARSEDHASLEETYGVAAGVALTDTALRDPVLRTAAVGGMAYRAVFADPDDPVDDAFRLAHLKLLTPEGRNFIAAESREVGFSSTIGTYDLYLVSTDAADLTLHAVCKGAAESGVRGELRRLRGTETVGDPVAVTDYAADETEAGGAPELRELTIPDARDGDVLVVRVWDGTPEATRENSYRITIHRTDAEHDPVGEAAFEQDAEDGYLHLSVYYQNVAAEAATISIPVAADTLALFYGDGTPYTGGAADGLSILPDGGYTLEKARLTETPDENGKIALELTVGFDGGGLAGQQETPVKVLEIRCKKSADAPADWLGTAAPVMLYDADRLELEFQAKVTEVLPGRTVTGTFLAYNPSTAYTGTAEGAFQVYLKEPGGVREVRADTVTPAETDGSAYGLRTFAYRFEGSVSPGVYTLTVRKPAHTPLSIEKVTVGDADVDLDALLRVQGGGPPELTVGDVDGDGWVRTYDKQLLTNAARYGAAAEAGEVCDLDGDGFVRAFDLYLLLPHYGMGSQTITLRESGEAQA